MIDIQILCESFENCLGWPYVSPGSNDENGIDCSGLFVKAYHDQGQKIYHGSNTIFREYLSQHGEISSEVDLQPGMAVFKWNSHTPEKFKDDLGDFQHIGLVTSVSPLRIIHASSVAGRVICDTKVGKWKYWGWLKGTVFSTQEPSDSPRASVTICSNGGKVNLRTGNGIGFHRITSVQPGTSFPFIAKAENGWLAVLYRKQVAWVSEAYGKLND